MRWRGWGQMICGGIRYCFSESISIIQSSSRTSVTWGFVSRSDILEKLKKHFGYGQHERRISQARAALAAAHRDLLSQRQISSFTKSDLDKSTTVSKVGDLEVSSWPFWI